MINCDLFLPVAKNLNVKASLSPAEMHSLMLVSCLLVNGFTKATNSLKDS